MFSIAVIFPPKITWLGSHWSKGNLTPHRNWRKGNASREEQLCMCLRSKLTNRFWYEFWRLKKDERPPLPALPTAGAGNRRGLGGNASGGGHPPRQPRGRSRESRGDEWRPEELGGEHSSAPGPVKSDSCRSRGSNLGSVTSSEHLAQPRCAWSSR